MALQKHKGSDGPSKHEVHLQRCQEVRVMCRVRVRVRVGVMYRVRVEDIRAKTQASSVNPLNNSCYLVGILCLNSPTIPVFK